MSPEDSRHANATTAAKDARHMNELEHLTVAHNCAAVQTYQELGTHLTTLWADAPGQRLVAVPFSSEAMRCTSDDDVIGLLASMSLAIGAQIAGRCDEAWSREFDPSQIAEVRPGDLQRISDLDPLVKTVLISHGIDLENRQQVICYAHASVHDDGTKLWHQVLTDSAGGVKVEEMRRVADIVARVTADWSTQTVPALAASFADIGWTLQRVSAR